MESAGWEGGRLLPGTGNDKVLYHVTDHLGSVRAVRDAAGNVLQRFDYYPFGSLCRSWSSGSTPSQQLLRYRFSGKEVAGQKVSTVSPSGVPAVSSGNPYLDFGARLYDPKTATWLAHDPKAEKFYPITPLAFCHNNPLTNVDPTGEEDWKLIIKGTLVLMSGIGNLSTALGATAATAGAATPLTAFLGFEGAISALAGLTMILYGATNDPSEQTRKFDKVMPTGEIDLIFELAGQMFGDEAGVLRDLGSVVSLYVGGIGSENVKDTYKTLSNSGTISQIFLYLYDHQDIIDAWLHEVFSFDHEISFQDWLDIKRNPEVQY